MTTESAESCACGRGPGHVRIKASGCDSTTEKAYTPPVSTILRGEALNPPEAITEQAQRGWWLAMCRIQHLIDSGVIAVVTPPTKGADDA